MIDYQPKNPKLDEIVATVFQGGYGLAHGPQGNLRYLATYGALSCVAMGIVLHKKDETAPRIAIGHFDFMTAVKQSVNAMLSGLDVKAGEKPKVYLASGHADEHTYRTIRGLFPSRLFDVSTDIVKDQVRGLVFDLTDGQPIVTGNFTKLHHYGPLGDIVERRIDAIDISGKKKPLLLELDMRTGIPMAGLAVMVKAGNPYPPVVINAPSV